MPKTLGLITIHGMGDTEDEFAYDLEKILRQNLGEYLWKHIHHESIYYQPILQKNQQHVWKNMKFQPSRKLRWNELRKFMLFGFADASSLEHKKTDENSVYKQTQKVIVESLRKVHQSLENQDFPLIVIAQSLGGQVISNYIWDAQAGNGVWNKNSQDYINPSDNERDFLILKTMRYLLTTGCNIPLFVAGFDKIVPFDKSKMHPEFQWKNYYDRDDVLGWPLQPLSDEYDQLVEDIEIDSGKLLSSRTPLSHTHYWTDSDFTEPLIQLIKTLI